MSGISLTEMVGDLATEVTDVSDLAEETGGAWPKGWYKADVVEGYATKKGTQFTTEDVASKDGSSRNLRVCFKVRNGSEERFLHTSLNYRVEDFTTGRIAEIKTGRERFANQQEWPDKDLQRSSLAIAKIGGLQKATKAKDKQPASFIGKALDVHLGIDKKGYNEPNGFAEPNSKTA